MKNNNETAAQTPQDLVNDLHALVAEAEKMMGGAISEHSGDELGVLRSRFDAAQERLADLYEGTRKKVIAGAKCADQTIRANPYQAVAVAAGVGLLVGVLLGRRTK
jgi:ElaB/YqjD/DUF883 family membrane-anchored ribosome-binding protein